VQVFGNYCIDPRIEPTGKRGFGERNCLDLLNHGCSNAGIDRLKYPGFKGGFSGNEINIEFATAVDCNIGEDGVDS